MPAQVAFEEHSRLLHFIAAKVLRRVWSAGAKSVSHDDIFQELCIAWCVARDKWEPSYNVPFSAYLSRGAFQHINRWVDSQIGQATLAPISIDTSGHDWNGEASALHDAIPSADKPIDEVVIEKDFFEKVRSNLSPLALLVLDLWNEPPPELVEEAKALQTRAQFARSRGITAVHGGRFDITTVMNFMGLNLAQRRVVYAEINASIEFANQ